MRTSEAAICGAICVILSCQPPPDGESEPAAEVALPAALTSPSQGVRVDIGPATQEQQDRYERWDGGESKTFTALGGFTATIKRGDGSTGVQFLDRNDVDSADVGNLVEDGAASSLGLRLVFTNLPAASYELKTYHHDASTAQGTVDILVTDADGTDRLVADEVPVTTGTGTRVFGSALFSFRSNGSGNVTINIRNGAVARTAWLNGFNLTRSAIRPPARADFGATGQQTQSKYSGWTNTESKTFKDLDGFSATIKRADGTSGVTWFDRGDVSATNGNLVEDGVLSSAGLRLTLTGLAAGQYQLKTYHHDATVTEGTIDISVDDADRTNALVANEVTVSKGTSSPTITTATFLFRASGTADVRVYLRKGAVTTGSPLVNGFDLSRVYRDLDVTHIARTPRYFRYDLDYGPINDLNTPGTPTLCPDNVGKKRWPAVGESVTYTGTVKNLGTWSTPSGAAFQWKVGGTVVGSGTLPSLAAGASTTVTLARAFPGTPERIELVVDSGNTVLETDEVNNRLEIGSHDLTLSIWVEKGQYDAFKAMPSATGAPSSFEEWIEKHFLQMNSRFAESTYPFAPSGIIDRVRIDKLVIVTDQESQGHTGAACATEANDPDKLLIDGRWSFADGDSSNAVGKSWSWSWYVDYVDAFPGRIDWGLIHELSHQLGLIDEYRMNLTNDPSTNNGFHVRNAAGAEISAHDLPTYFFDQLLFKFPGVMVGADTQPHNDGNFYENHSVGGMNAHARKRRGYFGEYMFDTPSQTAVVVRDASGVPLAGAKVELFQKIGNDIDNTAEFTGTADSQGRVTLPNRSVTGFTTETGHTLRANPFGRIHHEGHNGLMFVRATRNGAPFYGWLFIIDLNVAFWSGKTGSIVCTLDLQPPRPTEDASWPPARPPAVCQ
jgi:hypothetical protein